MAGSAVDAVAAGGAPGSLTMASMILSGTPARLSLISPSVLVSNFRDAERIFWMITESGRPAFTMPTTLSLVSTSWAEASVPLASARAAPIKRACTRRAGRPLRMWFSNLMIAPFS